MRNFSWHPGSIRSVVALIVASSLILTACTWSLSVTVNPETHKASVRIGLKAAMPIPSTDTGIAESASGASDSAGKVEVGEGQNSATTAENDPTASAEAGKGSGVSDTASITATAEITATDATTKTAAGDTTQEATAVASTEVTATTTTTDTAGAGQAATQNTTAETGVLAALEADGRFNTLLSAIQIAGLTDLLADGSDDFTLFAPTDQAFANIPKPTLDKLLQDRKVLTDLLLYHIGYGKVPADKLVGLSQLATNLPHASLNIKANGDSILINGATVTQRDIAVTRGIVHVIDGVLMPPVTLAERLKYDGRFNTLAAALETAGLTDLLAGKGPYTVFAPTDEAFAKLPAGTLDALLKDPHKLSSILTYHVFKGRVSAKQISRYNTMWPLNRDATLKVARFEGGVKINAATLIVADIPATNGVIQVIDAVLIPAQ